MVSIKGEHLELRGRWRLKADIIRKSYQKPYIAFSPEVSEALKKLKLFNIECIYLNPIIKKHVQRIKELFEMLFETYRMDIKRQRKSSVIFAQFLKDMTDDYTQRHKPAEIVRDFISGMTDQYFLDQFPVAQRPKIGNI